MLASTGMDPRGRRVSQVSATRGRGAPAGLCENRCPPNPIRRVWAAAPRSRCLPARAEARGARGAQFVSFASAAARFQPGLAFERCAPPSAAAASSGRAPQRVRAPARVPRASRVSQRARSRLCAAAGRASFEQLPDALRLCHRRAGVAPRSATSLSRRPTMVAVASARSACTRCVARRVRRCVARRAAVFRRRPHPALNCRCRRARGRGSARRAPRVARARMRVV